MNKDDLNENLSEHLLCMTSKGKEGKKADLRGADLRGADLRGAEGILYLGGFDTRGYTLVAWLLGEEPWFNAGCLSFEKRGALNHWGSAEYEDAQRGAQYVKAVEFLAGLLK